MLQASTLAFDRDMQCAMRCFRKARTLLDHQSNALSLWPVHLEMYFGDTDLGRRSDLGLLRSVMIKEVDLNIGRVALYLPEPDFDLSRKSIGAFVDSVPCDTHYFFQAHYELARALMHRHVTLFGSRRARSGQRKLEDEQQELLLEMEALIGRAKAARDVPTLLAVTESDFPMMTEVHGFMVSYAICPYLLLDMPC
eukprot:3932993-Rhodomonas_salina.1